MKKHIQNVHKQDEILQNKTNLERMIRKRFKCDMCDFVSTSKENIQKHTETVHKHKWDKCDMKSTTKENLQKHTQSGHEQNRNIHETKVSKGKTSNSKRIECKLCDKKFNKVETFNTHMMKSHKQNI